MRDGPFLAASDEIRQLVPILNSSRITMTLNLHAALGYN